MITTVYNQMNDTEYTNLTLLHFKKAFDSVKQSILIKKLEHYEIRGVTLDLLSSFLTSLRSNICRSNIHPLVLRTTRR